MRINLEHHPIFETAGVAREIGLENILTHDDAHQKSPLEHTFKTEKHIMKRLAPTEYFSKAQPFVSTMLISPKNFTNIQKFARYFPDGLTDFLGFEVRLNGEESQTDWAFAISGQGDARNNLAKFLNNGGFPRFFRQTSEWNHIRDFVQQWTESSSPLYKKILGAWLEFDMPDSLPKVLVPSVFFNPYNINGISAQDPSCFEWFTKTAIPILTGYRLNKTIEQNLSDSLKKMPQDASLFIVGIMLSRETSAVRMSVHFRNPRQIIPYLNEVGWFDDSIGTFSSLIEDLASLNVNRMILDFDIGKRVGHKVAIECSFSPNKYHLESQWQDLLDYLVEKNVVAPDKRDELFCFPGIEKTTMFFNNKFKIFDKGAKDNYLNSIVRYITHVKIGYDPEEVKLKAKAYLAIRHFGHLKIDA